MGIRERKEREFKKREEEILSSAKEFLLTEHPISLNMEKIAQKLEIARTTIYLHFKNKDELLAKLSIDYYTKLSDSLKNIPVKESAKNQVQFLLRTYLNYCVSDREGYIIERKCEEGLIPENLSEETRARLETLRKERISLFEKVYNSAIKEKTVRKIPVYILFGASWGMLRGAVDVLIDSRLKNEISDNRKFLESVEEILFHGFLEDKQNGKKLK